MYPGAKLWLMLTLLATTQAANNPEVSWGDWIIVDETEPGTSILLRRITPKSVFVAPTFNGCSEGYRQDSLGRCVKLVKVNQQAQWNFFLERLNSMYAPSSTSKNPQKEAGPFHISLPIGSEGSQEESVVKKRVPPKIRDESVQTIKPKTIIQSTTIKATTLPPPTTVVTLPAQESTTTTPELVQPTMVDHSEVTSTEKEYEFQTDSTTETRKDAATESLLDDAVMLGDRPFNTEDLTKAESIETPKKHKENTSQLPEKPFVIIVTNEPITRAEETTNFQTTSFAPLTTEEEWDEVSETPSTTDVTTEGTTETNSRYIIDPSLRSTKYDESFSETKDISETLIRPTMKYNLPPKTRPKCDPSVSQVRDDSSDCESSETETVSDEREVTNPSVSLPAPATLPLLEPNTHVRFPSESIVPVRKTQSFVRFPEATNPHDDRPAFWYPSWQITQHPGIRGWPPSEDRSQDQIRKQYPPFAQPGRTWSHSQSWRRRFFQRD